MFAVTVDQVGSRSDDDRVEQAIDVVRTTADGRLVLPPERTAGDEFQFLLDDAGTLLDVVFALARSDGWSIGIGIGDVEEPVPDSTRAARGDAFVTARAAVDRAKDVPEHLALEVAPGRRLGTADVEPLVTQTVRARQRRSREGWELADLLRAGHSRTEAAELLGVTPQAVAKRWSAADLRSDDAVHAALSRLLTEADIPAGADTQAVADASAGADTPAGTDTPA